MHVNLGIGPYDYQGYIPPEELEFYEEDEEDRVRTKRAKKRAGNKQNSSIRSKKDC